MNKTRTITLFTALLAAFLLFATVGRAAVAPDAAAEKEAELIAVLASDDSPKAEKAITCKYLAIYGSEKAVPELAPLLADMELASWARIALEAIPGEEADAALREAMGRLDGRLLIGTINSIGVRGDEKAVDGLAAKLEDSDADVASAAAVALGKIGNAQATKTLAAALDAAPAAVRSAVAEGCILCAEQALDAGDTAEAVKLYDAVREADVPKQRVIEGTRGAILARGPDGIPLLVDQLRSDDKGMFRIGLTVARELSGSGVTTALVAELEKVPAERQFLLILALADRDDPAVLPAMLEAATGGEPRVQIAAIRVVERLGDASCVPTLLEVALDENEDVSQAARSALETLGGGEVDRDIAARLATAEGPLQKVLIAVAGQRRIATAAPTLLKAAEDADADVRTAALTALGSTISQKNLGFLIERVVSPENEEDTPAARRALMAASIRMPDREACAAQLAAAMSDASVPAKTACLEILGAMGGDKALSTLGSAAKDDSEELQDAASRLLGEWMTVDAAPVLLDLAKNAPEEKYRIRAMRGYIRLVRQFVVPDDQRVAMCRKALETAAREAEKKLILEVMERYPSVGMLRLAVEATQQPALKNQAAAVSLTIAQEIGGGSVDVKDLLRQIGQKPVDVEIVKAEYGAEEKWKDVTDLVRRAAADLPLVVLPSSSYNSAFGGDPAPGVVKQLKIEYRIDGKPGKATFEEDATIMLPAPE